VGEKNVVTEGEDERKSLKDAWLLALKMGGWGYKPRNASNL